MNSDNVEAKEVRDILGCTCSYNEAYDGKSWNNKTQEYEECECLVKMAALYEIGLEVIGMEPRPRYWKANTAEAIRNHDYYIRRNLRASQRKAWAKACGVKMKLNYGAEDSDSWDEYEAKGKLEPVVGESLGPDGVRRPIKGNSDSVGATVDNILAAFVNTALIHNNANWQSGDPNTSGAVTKVLLKDAKAALYDLLAAEAVELDRRNSRHSTIIKAIPLSKLKAIMEIKE